MTATLDPRPIDLATRKPVTWFTLVKGGWHVTFRPACDGGKVNVSKAYANGWVSTRLLPVAEARQEWRHLKERCFESLD
jgi:hypothetical protein